MIAPVRKSHSAFTIIELLVVIATSGYFWSPCSPQFLRRRGHGYRATPAKPICAKSEPPRFSISKTMMISSRAAGLSRMRGCPTSITLISSSGAFGSAPPIRGCQNLGRCLEQPDRELSAQVTIGTPIFFKAIRPIGGAVSRNRRFRLPRQRFCGRNSEPIRGGAPTHCRPPHRNPARRFCTTSMATT